MDLSGSWRVTPLTAELNRVGVDPDLDDRDWSTVEVPGHWEQNPALVGKSGPFLYRRSFTHRSPRANERFWLQVGGVLSSAEVWLDGSYLGDTVGYFAPNQFDITEPLTQRSDHLLALDVTCGRGGDSRDKSTLTGALQSGPLAPGNNPGGIWRPVAVRHTGPVAIRFSRLICTEAGPTRATLQIRLVVDVADAVNAEVATVITGPDGSTVVSEDRPHRLAAGENRIEWTTTIDNPRLWWPSALDPDHNGTQPLYQVDVAVSTDRPVGGNEGQPSDTAGWLTGLRTVKMDGLRCRVNGRQLFCKSIAYGPASPYLADIDPERFRSDARAIKATGCDMVRVYGHVTDPAFYEEADRIGLLVWQDMPLIGGYTSKVRSNIRSVARALVDHLGHHPSIALWCGHCEPDDPIIASNDRRPDLAARSQVGLKLARQLLPSWNRSMLDPLISRELRNADSSRTVATRSGGLPTPGETNDANLWLGWRVGRAEDLATIIRHWPRLGSFPGGIGTQSAAIGNWDDESPQWPGAEAGSFDRYLPRTAYPDGQSWALATRAYQAEVLRIHIETLRRLKYAPTGGFCIMAFADADPAGGFGIVDYDRHPKPANEVVLDACRPVIVVAELAPTVTVPDQPVSLAVHAISDLRHSLQDAVITATAHRPGWQQSTHWTGDLDPDCCVKVGDFSFTTPASQGPLIIDLALECRDLVVSNRYRTVVIPASEAIDPVTK